MGPLAMKRRLERVQTYIEMGKAEGADLVFGGGRPSHLNRGYFLEPKLFADVDNASTIAPEEIFRAGAQPDHLQGRRGRGPHRQ